MRRVNKYFDSIPFHFLYWLPHCRLYTRRLRVIVETAEIARFLYPNNRLLTNKESFQSGMSQVFLIIY